MYNYRDLLNPGRSRRSGQRDRFSGAVLRALAIVAVTVATAIWAVAARGGRTPVDGTKISIENAKPGGVEWQPLFANGPPQGIEGYASQVSVSPGSYLQLHVSTRPAAAYEVQIYRLGWYKGLGGRLMTCLPSCPRSMRGQPQPYAKADPLTGRVRERWSVTSSFHIPSTWTSGYYVAKLVLATQPSEWPRMGKSSVVPFVLKEPVGRRSRILVVSSVNTEQAYNNWGGKSLYDFNSGGHQATKVSFNRPYATQIFFFELGLLQFLESEPKLDISYTTDVDVHRNPNVLLRHRLVIVNGHDEYWSRTMRDAYERARDRRVNLGFFGGDIGDWQARFEDGERTLVEYRSPELDPTTDPRDKTTKFGTLVPPRPQCQLLGTMFSDRGPERSRRFKINPSAVKDRWFAGTGFKAGDTFASGAGEMDVAAPQDCPPYPKTTFFSDAQNPSLAPAVRYTAPSGAIVFGVGSYALSTQSLEDARVRRFARNAILDLSHGGR